MWGLENQHKRIVIGCMLCNFFCTFYGLSLISAMKAISQELKTDYVNVMWMTEASFISAIMFALLTIAIANKYGKTRTQIVGLAVIVVSALLTSMSTGIEMLILTKIMAGLGVAFIVTSNTSIIADVVDKRYIGEVLAVNYAVGCLGAAAGPLLGMTIQDLIGWRGFSLLFIPLGILLIFLIRRGDDIAYEPDSRIEPLPHILFIIGTGLVLNGFFVSLSDSWIVIPGIIALAAFFFMQWKSPKKIIDTTIFDNKLFVITAILGLLFYFSTYCIDDAIVDRLEFYGDKTVLIFGVAVSIVAIGGFLRGLKPTVQLIASPLLARMARDVSPMKLTIYAFIILMFAPVIDIFIKLFVNDATVAVVIIVIVYVILAISSSIFSPQNKAIMIESVRKEQRNTASSISSIIDNIGRLLGVLIMVNLLGAMGETSSDSLGYATVMVIAFVFIICVLGIYIAYRRRNMPY